MAKKYKPHMMYCKDGSATKAMTYKEHLALKKKGCGHKKPKDKDSPMKMDKNKGSKDRSSGIVQPDRKLPPKRRRGQRDKDGNIIGGIR
jgi:hypothetical protein